MTSQINMVKMPFQCSSMSQPLWVCTSKKMDENTSLHFFLLNNIIKNNRKRRQELDDDVDWYLQNKRKRKNDGSDDILIMTTVQTALMMHSKPQHKPRMPNVDRDGSKIGLRRNLSIVCEYLVKISNSFSVPLDHI